MKRILLVLLMLLTTSAFASLFDGKYSQNQVFDVQRNGCYSTGGSCSVSNMINPFVAPYTNWTPMTWASGDYVQFYDAGGGQVGMKQFASNGTFKQVISSAGYVQAIGSGIVYIGEPNYGGGTGYFISNSQGFAYGSSVTVTNVIAGADVTMTVLNNYSASTTPLAAGQTATQNTAPTVTGTSVTYTTRTVTSGNVTTVYRTPVTTTTYSDGTSTNTNGTETLYQTRTASTVVTNKIVGNTLTTISTPISTVNTSGVVTVEANGTPVSVDQTIQRGLNYQVWRYDSKTYSCGWLGCIWDLGRRTPSTNISSYGNPVRTGLTTNGMYLATNGRLPNGDSSWVGYNDNTVIRYTGTITIPTTTAHPAGSVYRIYFYNNTDDGFKLLINGTTVINQNSTDTWQKLIGYTSNGWLDVVAGQTYNLEGWYWNVLGGVGHRFYWDYGAGVQGVPNSAFTTGTISTATIDTTGVSYTGGVVDVTGAVVAMYPDYVTNNSGSSITVAEGAGSSVITDDQQAAINDVTTRKAAMSAGNHVYIEQVGDSNTITILQTSNNNVVKGVGQTAALINGDSNNITIRQGNPAGSTAGRNLLELNLVGDANTLNLNQAQTTTGGYNTADSNDHYQLINVTGSRNSVTTEQTNINSTQVGHFLETTVSGNDNTLDLRQSSAGKTMFVNVNGNSNSATVQQKDLGNHHLDLKMTGDGNNAIILQEGNVGHKATVDMSRGSGGANMLDLSQSSNTNPLSFSIQQTCNQANCGTVVIRQTQ